MNSTREVLKRVGAANASIYVGMMWSLCWPQNVAGQQRSAPVSVLVFNYSGASRSTLRRAQHQADEIFRKAGLQATWTWCPVPLTAEADQACAAEAGLQSLRLRILDHPERNYFGEDIFGFSTAPALATVYYGRVSSLGHSDEANYEVPVILGCAIAHEIGHLLLGPGAHAPMGIMQAQWSREHLERAMRGQLLFTAEEAKRMRSTAAMRIIPPTGVATMDVARR